MTAWEIEKEIFVKMQYHDKRIFHKVKGYKRWKDIPSWEDYFKKDKKRLKQLYIENKPKVRPDPLPLPWEEFNGIVSIWQGDITQLEIEAIVNPTDEKLSGKGGRIDKILHERAGPHFEEEIATLNGCKPGEAKITGGYLLPARYVIHTVGPQGEDPDLLMKCYNNSLEVLATNYHNRIAFPCISTDSSGYPPEQAAHVVLRTVRSFLNYNYPWINQLVFTMLRDEDVKIYEILMQLYFPFRELYD